MAAYTLAAQSSHIMPQPPGNRSSQRTGKGFHTSKMRKNTKPSSKYFQLTRLSAEKIANIDKSMCDRRFGSAIGISGSSSVKCCPATSSITTNCGSLMPAYCAVLPALQTPMPPRITISTIALKIGSHNTVSWMSLPGTRKCLSMNRASESTLRGDNPASEVGRRKKISLSTIVITPTSEPYVPGAFGQCPTPNAVARAYAILGFAPVAFGATSVVGVIGIWQLAQLFVIFVENRLGHDIFFRRPISQVSLPAPLAAKGKFGILLGICWRLTNRTAVLHGNPSYPSKPTPTREEALPSKFASGSAPVASRS